MSLGTWHPKHEQASTMATEADTGDRFGVGYGLVGHRLGVGGPSVTVSWPPVGVGWGGVGSVGGRVGWVGGTVGPLELRAHGGTLRTTLKRSVLGHLGASGLLGVDPRLGSLVPCGGPRSVRTGLMVTSNARFTPAGKPALLKLTGVHGPKVEPKGDPGHCLAWINITHIRGVNGKEHILLIHRVNPTDGLAPGVLPKDVRGRTVPSPTLGS